MARLLFKRIVDEVTIHCPFFCNNGDCIGREDISPLLKCTSAIRQFAYGMIPDQLDEYLQMSDRFSRLSLDHFCTSVMQIFGPEYLRKPMMTDVVKLYRHHEETQGFSGMLESLDFVASQDLWILDAFFGVSGSNNDINILHQSSLFNDLKTGRAPEILFVANDVTYQWGYHVVDETYPESAALVKTIPEPSNDDYKRIRKNNQYDVYMQMNRTKEIKSKLKDIDKLLDQLGANDDLLSARSELLKQYHDIQSVETRESIQNAKIKWAIEGDENSKFFYGMINRKRANLAVKGVMIEGEW
nr:hypothetical protein [Tanacetum cinerariifolium]